MSYRNTEISQEWTVVFSPEALNQLAEPLQRPCHRCHITPDNTKLVLSFRPRTATG